MYFNQLVLEELDWMNTTFKVVGTGFMDSLTGELHLEQPPHKDYKEVFCLKDSKGGTWWVKKIEDKDRELQKTTAYYTVIQTPTWFKRMVGRQHKSAPRAQFLNKMLRETVPALIDQWNFKQGLSKDTRDSFGGLLDVL
jgi:hypothetical protein